MLTRRFSCPDLNWPGLVPVEQAGFKEETIFNLSSGPLTGQYRCVGSFIPEMAGGLQRVSG
jgi:hypothetical protein